MKTTAFRLSRRRGDFLPGWCLPINVPNVACFLPSFPVESGAHIWDLLVSLSLAEDMCDKKKKKTSYDLVAGEISDSFHAFPLPRLLQCAFVRARVGVSVLCT